MLINQVPGHVPVNVLHDQGIPNTLSGMRLAPIVVSSRQFMVWSLLLAILVLAVAGAVIIARASQ